MLELTLAPADAVGLEVVVLSETSRRPGPLAAVAALFLDALGDDVVECVLSDFDFSLLVLHRSHFWSTADKKSPKTPLESGQEKKRRKEKKTHPAVVATTASALEPGLVLGAALTADRSPLAVALPGVGLAAPADGRRRSLVLLHRAPGCRAIAVGGRGAGREGRERGGEDRDGRERLHCRALGWEGLAGMLSGEVFVWFGYASADQRGLSWAVWICLLPSAAGEGIFKMCAWGVGKAIFYNHGYQPSTCRVKYFCLERRIPSCICMSRLSVQQLSPTILSIS